MLCEEGLIIPTSNGAGKKTFYSRIEVREKSKIFKNITSCFGSLFQMRRIR